MNVLSRKFKEVVELLDFDELLRVKNDLNKGGDGLRILVNNKIKEEIKKRNEFCAVCFLCLDAVVDEPRAGLFPGWRRGE